MKTVKRFGLVVSSLCVCQSLHSRAVTWSQRQPMRAGQYLKVFGPPAPQRDGPSWGGRARWATPSSRSAPRNPPCWSWRARPALSGLGPFTFISTSTSTISLDLVFLPFVARNSGRTASSADADLSCVVTYYLALAVNISLHSVQTV